MKNKTKNLQKTVGTLIAGIVIATVFQTGLSFASDGYREMKQGSIRVEAGEADFPSLAQISMEKAKEIALGETAGEVLEIGLEKENGFLVYGVEIVGPEKTITDLKIDAGTGEILLAAKDKDDGHQYDDENEAFEQDDEQQGEKDVD